MPRRLENDRWLFGVTLGLCLFGVVMILSASAMTAEQQFGHFEGSLELLWWQLVAEFVHVGGEGGTT